MLRGASFTSLFQPQGPEKCSSQGTSLGGSSKGWQTRVTRNNWFVRILFFFFRIFGLLFLFSLLEATSSGVYLLLLLCHWRGSPRAFFLWKEPHTPFVHLKIQGSSGLSNLMSEENNKWNQITLAVCSHLRRSKHIFIYSQSK